MTTISRIFETMEYGPLHESPEPANAWLDRHGRRFDHFIGGEWSAPSEGDRFESRNPADQTFLARISQGSSEDLDRAVAAAHDSLGSWWSFGPHGRARVLHGLARSIREHGDLLALLETLDTGTPIREMRGLNVPGAARHFRHHAGWAQRLEREFPGMRPHGVAAQVLSRDSPLLMLAWKVAPALAAGNTVILKPSESAPLTALLFSELCDEAGVPPGVVNVVTGDGRTGAALVGHPGIGRVSFAGSPEVGREVRRATAGRKKRLSLELGGPSPFLVYGDADLDSVVEAVIGAIGSSQGPGLGSASRILVQEGTEELLAGKLRARMESVRLGDPLDTRIEVGPVGSRSRLDTLRSLVDQARTAGAEIWQPSCSVPDTGLFHPPTLCMNAGPAETPAQVEACGPVLVMSTFRTPEESIEMSNQSGCGLGASIWTESVTLALEVARGIQAGTIWVNCVNLFDAASGFGGGRGSGFGRQGGREGMWEYLRPRWETESGLDPAPLDRHRPTSTTHPGDRSVVVRTAADGRAGEVPRGHREEIHHAVAAARRAHSGWAGRSARERAQVLYAIAERLEHRSRGVADLLGEGGGLSRRAASVEVEAAVRRVFDHGALADTSDGRIHSTLVRTLTMATVEPIGILAIGAPEAFPLLGLLSTLAPAIAMGSTVVALPSDRFPLILQPLERILANSGLPDGVVNLVAGPRMELMGDLAAHDQVDAIWSFGTEAEAALVESRSIESPKRCWVPRGRERNWLDDAEGSSEEFLREATLVKNIWVPYGV